MIYPFDGPTVVTHSRVTDYTGTVLHFNGANTSQTLINVRVFNDRLSIRSIPDDANYIWRCEVERQLLDRWRRAIPEGPVAAPRCPPRRHGARGRANPRPPTTTAWTAQLRAFDERLCPTQNALTVDMKSHFTLASSIRRPSSPSPWRNGIVGFVPGLVLM